LYIRVTILVFAAISEFLVAAYPVVLNQKEIEAVVK
jgi:hypothetical protein